MRPVLCGCVAGAKDTSHTATQKTAWPATHSHAQPHSHTGETVTADDDLNTAVDDRLSRLRELAELRSRTRTATRNRLKSRRDVGLQRRHAAKLSRMEGKAT